jgi:hypothetical protein
VPPVDDPRRSFGRSRAHRPDGTASLRFMPQRQKPKVKGLWQCSRVLALNALTLLWSVLPQALGPEDRGFEPRMGSFPNRLPISG